MRIKPLDNLHYGFMWVVYICPIIPLDIGCLLVCLKSFNLQYFVISIIFTIVPVIALIIVRIACPYTYVIDEQYITKFKGKKVLFKIQKTDLKALIIKKARVFDYLRFLVSLITYNLSSSCVTSIAFVFQKCEVLEDYSKVEFKRESLKKDLYPNDFEYVEIISYKNIKKLERVLGMKGVISNER